MQSPAGAIRRGFLFALCENTPAVAFDAATGPKVSEFFTLSKLRKE
jgi:hypothetical protein